MKLAKLWAMVLVALLSGGCFRPAGDTVAPVTSEDIVQPTTDANVGNATLNIAGTASLPPVTIISPATRPTLSLGTPASALSPTPTLAPASTATVQTTMTPPVPAFITPALPLPGVTIVFPTPTQPGGATTATPSGLITPTALGGSSSECVYVVEPGDNLFRIAVNHNTTVDDMRRANPSLVGEAPILQPGQELLLPDCQAQPTTAPPAGNAATATPASPSGTTSYTVQAGDTLFSIAQRFGITVQDIINANTLPNPDALAIGQQLNIPQAGS